MIGGILCSLLVLTLAPYQGNVSALIHGDYRLRERFHVLENMVILEDPGYDGMLYLEIAARIPEVTNNEGWLRLSQNRSMAYAYQRFLLPLTAFLLSLGNIAWLPHILLIINVLCVLSTAWVVLWWRNRARLGALALALSPPSLIGLHFSLAEPLTLLLLTLFLARFRDRFRFGFADITLLSLLVLTREVNILFVAILLPFLLWRQRFHDAVLLLIPVGIFLALHGMIFGIFGEIPFLWSAGKRDIPGKAIWDLLSGGRGYTKYTLSAITLWLGFVLPATLLCIETMARKRRMEFLPAAALAFLVLMWTMPDHIWGSITSIGRVITPVYPLMVFFSIEERRRTFALLMASILMIGLAAGIGLALLPHPYSLT